MADGTSEITETRLLRRLTLERAVFAVATLLVDLSVANQQVRLREVLQRLGDLADVQRGFIYCLARDERSLLLEAIWSAPSAASIDDRFPPLAVNEFRWLLQSLEHGPLLLPSRAALPDGETATRRLLETLEIDALLAIPLRWNGGLRGFLGLAFYGTGIPLSPEEIDIVAVSGQLLSGAFEQRQQLELRQREEDLLRQAEALAHVGSWQWDAATDQLCWSDEMFRIFGQDPAHFTPRRDTLSDMLLPEDRTSYEQRMVQPAGRGEATDLELRIVRRDGEVRHLRVIGRPRSDEHNQLRGYFGVVQDVTELFHTRDILNRANRALQTVNACNTALVRANDEAPLMTEVCRIVVELGGYSLAWIGLTDGATSPLPPSAFFGKVEPGFFAELARRGTSAEPTPYDQAMSTKQAVRVREGAGEFSHAELWLGRDRSSCIALPLLGTKGQLIGVMVVYAATRDAFDDTDTATLQQLAADLAFGIEALRSREQRETAQHYLKATEESLRAVLEKDTDGVLVLDRTARIIYANPAAQILFGRNLGELQGEEFAFPQVIGEMVEIEVLRPDGTRASAEMRAAESEWYQVPALVVALHDITQQRRAQEQMRVWSTVLEHSGELIFVTDSRKHIIAVNKAFEKITGYSAAEAMGRDPHFLSSGLEEKAFYAEMWSAIVRDGHWQGEIRDRRKNGEVFPLWLAITAANREPGQAVQNYIAIGSDISARKAAEERIQYLAYHDLLTGLPNRALFRDRLEQAKMQASRRGDRVAVLFLDLDRFKNVNDTLGHEAGDELLRAVAARLQGCTRREDTVSRQGGDEFLILLWKLSSAEQAGEIAAKLVSEFGKPFSIHGADVHITPSIGIAVYPNDGEESDILVKNADAAMYFAKERGRNNFQYFVAELNQRISARFSMENALRRAMRQSEFELYYQPQINIRTGNVTGVEALLRWNRDDNVIGAAEFVGLAEETGLIVPIGEWVVQEACRQSAEWTRAGLPKARMAVNFSAAQFLRKGALERLCDIMKERGCDPSSIEVELTEGMIMQEAESSLRSLQSLKEIGVSLAIDDFGTGYSSLNYLRRFPIDRLKVDQSFVRDLPKNPADQAVTEAILALAKSLHLAVVAEGVETEEELRFLVGHDCEEIQGFYFLRPLPAAEIAAWWRVRLAQG